MTAQPGMRCRKAYASAIHEISALGTFQGNLTRVCRESLRASLARAGRRTGCSGCVQQGLLGVAAGAPRARRPEYKLHKKAARSKGTRGRADDGDAAYDGAAVGYGKRGGLVRVPIES